MKFLSRQALPASRRWRDLWRGSGRAAPFPRRCGERADCVFESALAMWLYGKLASSARHTSIGHNMMRRIMDFQRLERGDRFYGLWYTRGRSGPVYQDDTAMAIIFSLAGYRFMRDPLFLKRGVMGAE